MTFDDILFTKNENIINGLLTVFEVFPGKGSPKMQSAARRAAEGCAQQFEGFLFREDQENS